MKMSQERYALLKSAMAAVLDHHGPDKFKEHASQTRTTSVAWLLHNLAINQIQYSDTHPFFQDGKWVRVFPHQPSFDMYRDGENDLNDNHIQTAILKICKELGLCPSQTSKK